MSDWNSEQYLKFKKERTQPSTDLVNTIKLENPGRIIDIGCGPGNSTRALKNKYPEAEIIGADFSPNMIEKARKENEIVIVSVFVNPTQFGPNEDYDKYPRTIEADSKLCEKESLHLLFHIVLNQLQLFLGIYHNLHLVQIVWDLQIHLQSLFRFQLCMFQ